MKRKKQTGFTIVELLIVIVVIGILAAITIAAYNGVQNRANDVAVQSDLKNIGTKILEYKAINDALPGGNVTDLGPMNLKVSRSAYGAHYTPGSAYNLVYCLSSSNFILVAASRSGNVFVFRDGAVSTGVGPLVTHTTTCGNNGLATSGVWFYNASAWQAWIN